MDNPHSAVTYFQRFEQKYVLDQFQYNEILRMLPEFTREDEFFRTTVYSIYYDTDDFKITKKLLDKSAYKEKLRLRSYGSPNAGDPVYVELKKKLNGISYKQRFPIPFINMESCFNLNVSAYTNYISGEANWFLQRHELSPKFMLWYDRLAFRGIENKDLRITFDSHVRWRDSDIDYAKGQYGYPLLADNTYLMELKVEKSIPLFLARHLASLKIFPVSFSKHKMAYENIMNSRRHLYD
jgi:SPX domain protein involved in polyphosphate accumulation